jgi:uncharacterized protein (DUF4415 family)
VLSGKTFLYQEIGLAFVNEGTLLADGDLIGTASFTLDASGHIPSPVTTRPSGGWKGWAKPAKTRKEIEEEIREAVKRQRIELGILPKEIKEEIEQEIVDAANATLEITGEDIQADEEVLERINEAGERYIERMQSVYREAMAEEMRMLWKLELERRIAEEYERERGNLAAALLLAAVA